jgi:hypothetical protein
MNAALVRTHGKVEARDEEKGPAGMSMAEAETLMWALIESARAAVPTPDPARTERVRRRILATLEELAPTRRHA